MATMLLNANALKIPLADESVSCVVTSPPYWGLRDYGIPNQLGLEPTPEQFVANVVDVFREVWRVLHPTGTLWLNLGDTYGTGTTAVRPTGNRGIGKNTQKAQDAVPRAGGMAKQLMGIPWRVAFALQADGWYLRSDIIWHKPNPMPESVTDRPTKAHEYLFLLSKQKRYFYDGDSVREDYNPSSVGRYKYSMDGTAPTSRQPGMDLNRRKREASIRDPNSAGRNRRSVWTIPTQSFSGAHYATFPEKLVEPCIKAGTSEYGVCPECGCGWERVVEKDYTPTRPGKSSKYHDEDGVDSIRGDNSGHLKHRTEVATTTLGWQPTCTHYIDDYLRDFRQSRNARKRFQRMATGDWWKRVLQRPVPFFWDIEDAIVLDPFVGSGTVPLVARKLGRRAIGLDLSYSYLRDQAKVRLGLTALEEWEAGKNGDGELDDLPLFAET